MLSEFKDNGYVVLKNAISKDALEFINATWDRLKDKPFSEHFPYVIGEHIQESTWEMPFSFTNFGSAPFGHYAHLKLQQLIEEKLSIDLVPTYYFSREYYTDAVLYAHRDRPSCEISATIAIDFKTRNKKPWAIWVKKDNEFSKNELSAFSVSQGLSEEARAKENCIEVMLDPGDMMVYQGCNVIHWRDPLDGDYSRHIFIHFVHADGKIFKDYPEIANDFRPSLTASYDDIDENLRDKMRKINSLTRYPNWAEENACLNI
jgi:hypothetical protein